jgi:putative redox protein
MIDKTKQLKASVKLMNNKLNFMGIVDGNEPVSIDYIAPLGDDSGYTSLELLLMSLNSCIGSSVLTFLRKMQKTITGCEIHATGYRKEEHPTGLKKIDIYIELKSPDVTADEMAKVILMTEATYCPVWAMMKGNVEVDVKFDIEKV